MSNGSPGRPGLPETSRAAWQRHVDLLTGQERLEIPQKLGVRVQRRRPPFQQHSQIDVARRVRAARHRRSELQQQPNAVRAAHRRKPIGIHRSIIGPSVIGPSLADSVRRQPGVADNASMDRQVFEERRLRNLRSRQPELTAPIEECSSHSTCWPVSINSPYSGLRGHDQPRVTELRRLARPHGHDPRLIGTLHGWRLARLRLGSWTSVSVLTTCGREAAQQHFFAIRLSRGY